MAPRRLSVDRGLGALLDAVIYELENGAVVAVPSDTTYALLADDAHTGAADRLFKLTKRQRTFELSLLVSGMSQVDEACTGVTPRATMLMEKFWPGPLSVVLPRNPQFVADLGSDEETVGLRCPDDVLLRELCDAIGPVANVGAGIHGTPSANSPDEVVEMFGEGVSLVIDAGITPGRSATVVDATGSDLKLLREGAVTWQDIVSATG